MQKRVNSVLRHFVLICHYEEDHVGELKIGREGGGGGQGAAVNWALSCYCPLSRTYFLWICKFRNE